MYIRHNVTNSYPSYIFSYISKDGEYIYTICTTNLIVHAI